VSGNAKEGIAMDVTTNRHSAPAQRIAPAGKHRWLGIALIALGLGLIANSLLGPFVVDAIRYPLSESVLNQTTGLETVSLLLIAPLCILAGVLAIRGRAVAPLVAFGPAPTPRTCSSSTWSGQSTGTTPVYFRCI
jgi:hypothetical protein